MSADVYVDTHCHIQSAGNSQGERTTGELWAKNPELTGSALLKSAKAAGVTKVICVGCDSADSQLAIALAAQHGAAWASIGIHPHEAKTIVRDEAAWDSFAALATQPKVVAIGECGLDYFYNHSDKADQIAVLYKQLELAEQTDLPVIFHVREAYDDFWPIFDQYPRLRGVLHSFTDTQANLEQALQRNLYIGVNGIATFAKLDAQRAMYRAIPASNLVLETDAPYLTPTPHRGSINEPKQIVTVANFLADLKSIDISTLAATTTSNALKLFGLN